VNLSEGRLSALAQALLAATKRDGLGKILNEHIFLLETKRALTEEFSLDERLDQLARARIPRSAVPGSREWDVHYRRFYEEERRKLGR